MYKRVLKFCLFLVVVLGASMFVSGDKAAALTRCPTSFMDAQNNLGWGVSPAFDGSHGGNMAGMIVHAYDASNGKEVDVNYTLNSGIRAEDPYIKDINGHPTNLNDRIFIDVNGDFSNRTNHLRGRTNDLLLTPGGFASCKGWNAYGPFTVDSNDSGGNGYVLDCGPAGEPPAHFWFSEISKPLNADNPNGYWSIQVVSPKQTFSIPHYTEGITGFGDNYFTVWNGSNTYVNMVWHPQSPQNPPDAHGVCTYFTATGSKTNRREVQITGVSEGRAKLSGDGSAEWTHPANFTEYTPAPVGQNVSPGSYTKEWWYRPIANTIHIKVTQWEWNGTAWVGPTVLQDYDKTCYTAQCSITSVEGDGPVDSSGRRVVVAGRTMRIYGTYVNTSPAPDNLPIWSPAVQGSTIHTLFSGPAYVGVTYNFTIDLPAPNTITNQYIGFTPVYHGSPPGAIGSTCSANVPIYQEFKAPGIPPQSSLSPTDENPDKADYNTQIKVTGVNVPVYIPTTSCFYKEPPAKTSCSAPMIHSTSGGTYSPGTTQWSGSYAIPDGSFVAGDRYCARIHMDYTSGYRGPGGPNDIVDKKGPYDSSSCDKVTNKPYFQVKQSGASAGTALRKADGTCSINGGLLAGWNNNSGGQERGAGAQLSALALVKITGFASAQSPANAGANASALTFANNGPGVSVTEDSEEPELGGNFTPSGYCMDNISPTASSTVLPGGSSYAGNPNVTGNQSIFVNGDVTITNNVMYGGWTGLDNAPSFVLKATGNIKIAPNVTRLDGLFVSDQKIYTCATSSGPITGNSYATCKNQLLVHGGFAAEQIKLGRTFGSLRDEEPKPGAPAGKQLGLIWSSCGTPGKGAAGESCPPTYDGLRCTLINEPGDSHGWYDNRLCVQNSSSLQLAWTYFAGNNASESNQQKDLAKGGAGLNYLKSHGYPYCTQWSGTGDNDGWSDNYLCANQPGIAFKLNNDTAQYCTRVNEIADPDGGWKTGHFLCEPKAAPAGDPTPKGPPFTDCSNKGIQVTTASCAAEAVEFGPELYLSNPNIKLPNNGAPRWDSITGLPPVL